MRGMSWKCLSGLLLAAALLVPARALACAACYGQSDSPLAEGMNWGILSLLGVVVCVLGSVATFFVFLGRRSAAAAAREEDQERSENPEQKS
jgi:heme/copper-type cytochrome/quinol oxidase subunit 2